MTLARRCLVLALATIGLGCSAVASQAQAAAGDPFVRACRTGINAAALAGCSPNVRGSSSGAALSPDGRQLYVALSSSDADTFTGIQQYNRNTDTGALSQAGCLSGADFPGCTTVAGLDTAFDMRFSPDGRTLYVASSSTLFAFNRNTGTGALNKVGDCFGSAAGCTAIAAGNSASSVGVTNSHVYLRGDNSLTVFTRDGTGALTQGACYTEAASASCTDRVGLASGLGLKVEVSPDGKHVYVPFLDPGGVSIWEITGDELDQESGTSGGCISSDGASGSVAGSCVNGADTLALSLVTEIDPSGGNVYVAGIAGLTVYGRDAGDGELTQRQCLAESAPPPGCADVTGVADTFDLEVTPDGSDLIGASAVFFAGGINGLSFFRRASNGTLTQRSGTAGCMSDGGTGGACQNVPALGGIGTVEVAGNSRDFYPTGSEDGLVGHYERDFAPVCGNRDLGVGHNTPLAVGFACSDANGDPLTFSVPRAPASGLLGAIDQGGANVVYSPNSGFQGGDSFDYRATGRGVNSNTARVNLSVGPPPPPPLPPPPPPRELPVVRSTTNFSSLTFATFTKFTKLTANRLPAGATVTVTCKTKKKSQQRRCPKRKRYRTTRARRKLNLGKPFANRRLPPGTKISILIAAPNFRSKRIIYTVRNRKKPIRRVQCLNAAGRVAPCV